MKSGWLVGNRSRLPLPVILSLRSQFMHRRALTSLTIVAFAASVGLAASVEMATRSMQGPLRRTTDSLVGAAQIEVTAGDAGVPENLLDDLRSVPGVVSASPVIQKTFRIAEGPHEGEPLRVVAIDLLYEHEVRNYHIRQEGFTVRDPLRLVAVPGSLMVSETLAARLGLAEGEPISLRTSAGSYSLTVRGLVHGGLSEAFGGQIAVMDVYSLQHLVGMGRRLDRIDVAVDPALEIDVVEGRIAARVGDLATVRRSALREIYLDSIMETVNVAVWTIALIAILLSLFLTYAVTSLSVDRRLEELSLLRAAGMQGRSVSLLIVTDAALLAALGTAVGFAAAVQLSGALADVLSRASEYLQHMELDPLEVRASTVWTALLVGVPVACLAAIEPAVRAGRRSPVDVLRGYRLLPATARVSRPLAALAAGMAALAVSAWLQPALYPGGLRLVLVIVCGVIAVGAGASQLLRLVFPQVQRLLGACIPRVGYLVGSSLLERPVELGATLAVWAAVTAGLIALLSAIQSIAVSWDAFNVGLNGRDAVLVYGQDPLSSADRELIRRETIERVRRSPGVRGVAEYYVIRTLFRGEEVSLETRSVRELVEHSGAEAISDDPAATIDALLRGEIAMNRAFARHFGMSVGDSITLPTSQGPHTFRIGAFARGFAGPTGQLLLDVDAFLRHFETPGVVELAIWVDEPRGEVLRSLQRQVTSQALFFRDGEKFHRHTRIVVARFNDLLMLPVGMIGIIGVTALLNLLLGNVLSRRRDLAIVRGSGGTRANLVAIVVLNALLVGYAGTLVGLLLGFQWSQVATDAVAGALGYQVDYAMDWSAVWRVALATVSVAGLTAIWPALSQRDEVPREISSLS